MLPQSPADGGPAPVGAVLEVEDVVTRGVRSADFPPRARIEEAHGPVVVADGERAAVRAQRDGEHATAVPAHETDGSRPAGEGGEEVAATLHRVLERHPLSREEERAVQIVLDESLCAQPLRVGGERACRRAVPALRQRESPPAMRASTSRAGRARTSRAPQSPVRSTRPEASLGSVAARLLARKSRSDWLSSSSCPVRPLQSTEVRRAPPVELGGCRALAPSHSLAARR